MNFWPLFSCWCVSSSAKSQTYRASLICSSVPGWHRPASQARAGSEFATQRWSGARCERTKRGICWCRLCVFGKHKNREIICRSETTLTCLLQSFHSLDWYGKLMVCVFCFTEPSEVNINTWVKTRLMVSVYRSYAELTNNIYIFLHAASNSRCFCRCSAPF